MMRIPSTTALRTLRTTSISLSPASPLARCLSTSSPLLTPAKPSIKAIAELRKLVPGTSMLKAKEALLSSRSPTAPDVDSIPLALEWLEADRKSTGAKKADKVASRSAREGLIAVTILSDGLPSSVELKGELKEEAKDAGIGATSAATGAIVEVNCETDFVAKNEVFAQLVKDVVHTVALFPGLAAEGSSGENGLVEVPVEKLLEFPLLSSNPQAVGSSMAPKTVGSEIIDVVSRLGEKISIARAAAIFPPSIPSPDAARRSDSGTARGGSIVELASAFAHGGSAGFSSAKDTSKPDYLLTSGKIASLIMTRFASPSLPDLLEAGSIQPRIRALTRSLARQVAGLETKSIDDAASATAEDGDVSSALYRQPFMMLLPSAAPEEESNAQPVRQVLSSWAKHNNLTTSEGDSAVEVLDMHRWELGETAAPHDDSAPGFADEVRKAAGLA